MKLLFDQNLSRKLVTCLADIFPDASHGQFHSLVESTDTEIWEFAKSNEFCIVTQDADFAERSRLYDAPSRVVCFRCGNTPNGKVEALIRFEQGAIEEVLVNPTLHCLELH